MPQLKISLSKIDEYRARQVALRRGCSVSEVGRRAVEALLNSEFAASENPEAVVDQLDRRNGSGKRITACYLSPPLAGIIRKLAVDTDRSQSHVLRDLVRSELRRRDLLPSNNGGTASA